MQAELQAFLEKATAESAKLEAESDKLKVNIETMGRRLDAENLSRELRDSFHVADTAELRAVIEAALADIPDEQLNDVALARLKCRHASLHLIKLIAALRGTLSAATEIALQNTFEKVLVAPINVQQGNQEND